MLMKPCKLGKVVLENGETYTGEVYLKSFDKVRFKIEGLGIEEDQDLPNEFRVRMRCQNDLGEVVLERMWTEHGKYNLPRMTKEVKYREALPQSKLEIKSGFDVKTFTIEEA